MALLEIDNLTTSVFRRGGYEMPVIRDVTVSVDRGETIGVVGESGSGKSVTWLSVMGLIPSPPMKITSGSIVLDGVELTGRSEEDMLAIRGRKMAMVYQDPMTSLNPVMRIGDQIDEGQLAHGRTQTQSRERTLEVLGEVGIPDPPRVAEAYPHELSGGMRQRVMIAIALALSPDLLIFDEPTTALDVTIQQQILYLVRELQKKTGVAVVWVTHDLGVVARLVNRVVVMYGGKVVEFGATHDIFGDPQHPYTAGLLAAVPKLRSEDRGALAQIPGFPPDLDKMPRGCPFEPRCRLSVDRCIDEMPPLEPRGGTEVACWVPKGDWR